MTDGAGLPLAFTLTPGQQHELTAFERTLKAVRLPGPRGRPRTRPKEKLAVNFAAMLKLAFPRRYLRILRPSDRT